jgi:hypothetical protein
MTKQEVYLTNIIRAKRCESLGRHRDEFVVRRLDKYPIRSMCFSSKFIMNFGIAVHSFSTLPILLRLGHYRSQMSNMKEKQYKTEDFEEMGLCSVHFQDYHENHTHE